MVVFMESNAVTRLAISDVIRLFLLGCFTTFITRSVSLLNDLRFFHLKLFHIVLYDMPLIVNKYEFVDSFL